MHPLVHIWARDRLSEELQRQYWALSLEYRLTDYRFRRTLVPHIDSCISLCGDGPFISGDSELVRAKMARKFALVYHENSQFQDEMELLEKSLEAWQKNKTVKTLVYFM